MRNLRWLFICVLLYSMCGNAQTIDSLAFFRVMVKNINCGQYDKAIEYVRTASYNYDDPSIVDADSAIAFLKILNKKAYYFPIDLVNQCRIYMAFVIQSRGTQYYYQRDYQRAEYYYLTGIHIKERVAGEKLPSYPDALDNLSCIYLAMKEYDKAEYYGLKALEIRKATLGENSQSYLTSMHNMGLLYRTRENFTKAKMYMFEELRLQKIRLGEQHYYCIDLMTTIGSICLEQGMLDSAHYYYAEAINVSKLLGGERGIYYAYALANAGAVYLYEGDYATAEDYYRTALNIYKELPGVNEIYIAHCYSQLGGVYFECGDYIKSEKYYLEAWEIIKKQKNVQPQNVISMLKSFGAVYAQEKDYAKAEDYYLMAVDSVKKAYNGDHPSLIECYRGLGVLYYEHKDYDKAEKALLEALRICTDVYEESHITLSFLYWNLALVFHAQHKNKIAEYYFMAACSNVKDIYGENNPKYAFIMEGIGQFYYDCGNMVKANEYIYQASKFFMKHFLTSVDYMSENERAKFWTKVTYCFDNTYPSVYHALRYAAPAYDLQLFIKGLLQTCSTDICSSILESGDTLLISQWNRLKSLHNQIQYLESKNQSLNYLQSLRSDAESLEKELVRVSSAYRKQKNLLSLTWHDVAAALPARSMAIEYMLVPGDTATYCALVISSHDTCPRMIDLFTDKEIEPILRQSPTTIYSSSNGQYLSKLVWGPLLNEMENIDYVYVSPVNCLHQLSFESLPYDSTSTMADHWDIQRLSSTRELCYQHTQSYSSAAVYGGIVYDADTMTMSKTSCQYSLNFCQASRRIDVDSMNRGSVGYLPGTKMEAEMIKQILEDNNIAVKLFTSIGANEESFKALNGKRNSILHVGTHGFCWEDSVASQKEYFMQNMIGDPDKEHLSTDPLSRCGLLFAGANIALSGHTVDLPTGVQDGILTAKEISLIDLRGCELVILSACETAKGDISSEGVFGLQRAFKLAGVQTIIMSLWPVDDNATRMLMTEFYRNWLELHQTKREAFKNAQRTIRFVEDQYGDRMYENPVYWAGFVMLD